tara:strand:- start:8889 stop:10193 length:1305 start_codon:yes stop_codon:yes gene_type:complete
MFDNTAKETDESDLERLFAAAREHPLLTAEQEIEIDGRKWQAIEQLQYLLLQDSHSRVFLAQWAVNCSDSPPDINRFSEREHHFLLRRELVEYLPGGGAAQALQQFAKRLSCSTSFKAQHISRLHKSLLALSLPASLVAGLAELQLYGANTGSLSSAARALQDWQAQWKNAPEPRPGPLSEELKHGLTRGLQDYEDARDALVMHNLRLLYSIAGRYRGKGVSYLDLVQEGSLGLMRAAEKYDSSKGYRFSTYCFNWIAQAVRRCISDTGQLIRYPSHVQDQIGRLYGERTRHTATTGKELTDTELAASIGMSLEKTRSLRQLQNFGMSLDAPRFDDDTTSLLESIPADPGDDASRAAEQRSLNAFLLAEIQQLDPAEQTVIVGRWGLHKGPPLTRAEIADQMSVSREWVRQLERSALQKLSKNTDLQAAYSDQC